MKTGRLMLALSMMVAMAFFGTLPVALLHAAPMAQATAGASSAGLVDINSASASDLAKLPGIGTAYAQKIVSGRPYANKSQLKSKNIIPSSVYDKISGMIIARQGAK